MDEDQCDRRYHEDADDQSVRELPPFVIPEVVVCGGALGGVNAVDLGLVDGMVDCRANRSAGCCMGRRAERRNRARAHTRDDERDTKPDRLPSFHRPSMSQRFRGVYPDSSRPRVTSVEVVYGGGGGGDS